MLNQSDVSKFRSRPDMPNARLLVLLASVCLVLVAYAYLKTALPGSWQRPGSSVLQIVAALGGLLLLVPFGFSLGKRNGYSTKPNWLFILHVNSSLVGTTMVTFHAMGSLNGPPLFLFLCLLTLIITGVVARTLIGRAMGATFGTKERAFVEPDPELKAKLRKIIETKKTLLQRLDPMANEALFSVTLFHWLKSPWLSFRYNCLAHRESRLMGTRGSVSFIQAYWRPLHLLVAWLFLMGLLSHVVVVLFFAGYAANGGEIYWWHIASW